MTSNQFCVVMNVRPAASGAQQPVTGMSPPASRTDMPHRWAEVATQRGHCLEVRRSHPRFYRAEGMLSSNPPAKSQENNIIGGRFRLDPKRTRAIPESKSSAGCCALRNEVLGASQQRQSAHTSTKGGHSGALLLSSAIDN
jgi:hypothetical protein